MRLVSALSKVILLQVVETRLCCCHCSAPYFLIIFLDSVISNVFFHCSRKTSYSYTSDSVCFSDMVAIIWTVV